MCMRVRRKSGRLLRTRCSPCLQNVADLPRQKFASGSDDPGPFPARGASPGSETGAPRAASCRQSRSHKPRIVRLSQTGATYPSDLGVSVFLLLVCFGGGGRGESQNGFRLSLETRPKEGTKKTTHPPVWVGRSLLHVKAKQARANQKTCKQKLFGTLSC